MSFPCLYCHFDIWYEPLKPPVLLHSSPGLQVSTNVYYTVSKLIIHLFYFARNCSCRITKEYFRWPQNSILSETYFEMNVWIGCNTIHRTHFTKDSWAYNQLVLQKYVSLILKKMMVECCGMPCSGMCKIVTELDHKIRIRPLDFSQDFHYER